MEYCEDCGCKVYSNGCTNCNEELYILDQYHELDMEIPSKDTEFMKKATEQQRKIKNDWNKCSLPQNCLYPTTRSDGKCHQCYWYNK